MQKKQRKRPAGPAAAATGDRAPFVRPLAVWRNYVLVLLLALAAAAAGYRIFVVRAAEAHTHPQPRAAIGADSIMPAERYAEVPGIAQVYFDARRIPELLDGLYCYCECSKHSGHRSLLTCFHSDHAARCDICLGEAALAYRLHQEGRSLDEIRAQIDAVYGT